MATAQNDIGSYLETARELAAKVAKVADRIDQNRELPVELAHEIADKGFFRLLVPRSLGGSELDYLDFLRIVEVFAEVDASAGWCVNQNNVFATNSIRMPEKTAQEIWSDRRAVVTNGPPTSSAQAICVDGGYKLSGRWNFSSGSDHATWIAALTPIKYPDTGEVVPAYSKGGRVLLMPKKDVRIVEEAWQVNGLRGTASYSFEVDDLFVPDERSYNPAEKPRENGPIYTISTTLLFAGGFSTVALGVARASLNVAIEVAGGKTPMRERGLLRDKSTTQRIIGEAEATWSSAKAFHREATASAWEGACKNGSLTVEERIRMRLATTHAIRTAAKVVDSAYNLCGSSAIFTSNPIQRRFQDAHVITQHIQGRPTHYDTAGQFYLGMEPEGQF